MAVQKHCCAIQYVIECNYFKNNTEIDLVYTSICVCAYHMGQPFFQNYIDDENSHKGQVLTERAGTQRGQTPRERTVTHKEDKYIHTRRAHTHIEGY
jgi:hypothetical protein